VVVALWLSLSSLPPNEAMVALVVTDIVKFEESEIGKFAGRNIS